MKDPCACESLVEFQQATISSLEQLTQKHILDMKKGAGAIFGAKGGSGSD